jgi:uncharacterized small protein (DUF1192 family)
MAIETDDPEARKNVRQRLERLALEPLSVHELNDYIGELEAEITRAKTAIAAKLDHRSTADAFFRKP